MLEVGQTVTLINCGDRYRGRKAVIVAVPDEDPHYRILLNRRVTFARPNQLHVPTVGEWASCVWQPAEIL